MDLAAAGFGSAVAGALVITAYTSANYRLRRLGAEAVWFGGWALGALGMLLMGLGWTLLGVSGPFYHAPALQAAGVVVALLAAALYLAAATFVGRLRSKKSYTLALSTEGIYRFVRHPQALALCLLAIGVGMSTLSRPYLLTLPLWIAFWISYTFFEEHFELIPAYGARYDQYRRHTGRLLPTARCCAELGGRAVRRIARVRRRIALDLE